MKIAIHNLVTALDTIASIPVKNGTLEILSNVLIEAKGPVLNIRATNLNAFMHAPCAILDGTLDQPITVNAAKLRAIAKNLPKDGEVTMDIKDGHLHLRSGRSRFKLGTLPAAEFPEPQENDPEAHAITIDGKALSDAIKAVSHAQASGDVRYYLNGMLFDFKGDALHLVATDGHRLARSTLPCTSPAMQAIVPRDYVSLLAGLLEKHDEATLNISPRQLHFAADGIGLSVKLIDGKFPDYERVIPKQYPFHAETSVKELLASLHRASLLGEKDTAGLLKFDGQVLTVENTNQESYGAAQDQADLLASNGVEPFSVGVTMSYVVDALKAIQTPSARIVWRDPESAIVLHPTPFAPDLDTFVIMPRRL